MVAASPNRFSPTEARCRAVMCRVVGPGDGGGGSEAVVQCRQMIMLTIRAMVRVGPWVAERVEREEEGSVCERCSKQGIKEIWVCTVDADSDRLQALGGKPTWRIGSHCGPILWNVSEETWKENAKPVESRIRLAIRVQKVLSCEGLNPRTRGLLAERLPLLLEGTLGAGLQRHLGSLTAAHGRGLGLWK